MLWIRADVVSYHPNNGPRPRRQTAHQTAPIKHQLRHPSIDKARSHTPSMQLTTSTRSHKELYHPHPHSAKTSVPAAVSTPPNLIFLLKYLFDYQVATK